MIAARSMHRSTSAPSVAVELRECIHEAFDPPEPEGGRTMKTLRLISGMVFLSVSCASGEARRPMSANEHDAVARTDLQRANEKDSQARTACPGDDSSDACHRYWTSFRNPTRKRFQEADKYRRDAERHGAASRELRDAENRACMGLSVGEREVSPFFHEDDIVSVAKVAIDAPSDVLTGARVVFRQLPDMTPGRLQRELDCEAAHDAAIGFSNLQDDQSLVAVQGIVAFVHPVAAGLAVELRPRDAAGSRLLGRRVDALVRAKHQSDHEAAGSTLAKFEAAACRSVPVSARAACPLLGPAVGIEDVPGGVRVTFAVTANMETALAGMKCHVAYASAHGWGANAGCPLYVPGIEVRAGGAPRTIEIVSAQASVTADIRRRSREEAIMVRAAPEPAAACLGARSPVARAP
jgi:hypothetical protein